MKQYYQKETEKAINNFQISGVPVNLKLIYSVAIIKKAAAQANVKTGRLDAKVGKAIEDAVDRILKSEFDSQFVIDQVQGGAGTSMHMNVNEVIASIAEEILNDGTKVHPNDHVNMGQSTNDVIPTAIMIMTQGLIDNLIAEMKLLSKAFYDKSIEFKDIVKVARTHLQDAVPMTLGQSFNAYHTFVERNIKRIEENRKYMLSTNMGGSAIGSAINSTKSYISEINANLASITKYDFKPAEDLFDATQNTDNFLHVANLLKTFASGISKISSDLRMLASGPRAGLNEILLPELQKGSSIMPGKVNPVILEMINQICYQVYGNIEACFHASINSQFELNVMLPIYAKNINEAFVVLTNGIKSFREKVIEGIQANTEQINKLFDNSLCMATALNRYIGYDKSAELVKRAIANGTSLLDELRKENLIPEDKLEEILKPEMLTTPTDKFVIL